MTRRLLLTAALLLAFPASASAKSWRAASRLPLPNVPVHHDLVHCPDVAGILACTDSDPIVIHLGPLADQAAYYHEEGHAFDYLHLTATDHRNLGRWGSGEHFAEGFALCALPSLRDYRTRGGYGTPSYDFTITRGALARICGYVRLVARRSS